VLAFLSMSASEDYESLRQLARSLGFEAFGVAPGQLSLRRAYYLQWIQEGQHGEMRWLERNNDRRLHPENLLDEARSIIVLGLNYYQPDRQQPGRIAKYALGKDYHKVLLKKLKMICRHMQAEYGSAQRPYVDTGPLLENPLAVAAGLGWQGKSTILLNQREGTWLFLGSIVTTLTLPTMSEEPDRCGSCTRCIDACPTQAITAPYQLDARRCIAYLTIEHHGSSPIEFRRAIGDRIFGCDECLDVCPWNRFAKQTREAKFQPLAHPDARASLRLSQEEFDQHFAGTPIRRLGLARWKRNACVVLGNIGNTADSALLKTVAEEGAPMVAEHAQWAINEISLRCDSRRSHSPKKPVQG